MKFPKSLYHTIFLLFFSFASLAQIDKKVLSPYPENASIYDVDRFGNVYIVKENQLFKYNSDGSLYAEYGNFQWGDIDAIDISNPLYILVFYRTFQRIEYLDNQLNTIRAATDLSLLGLSDVSLIRSDKQQNIWMYDQLLSQVFKYNIEEQRIVNRSQMLSQLIRIKENPIQLSDDNYHVYLNIPGTGIVVFDQNAAYTKTLAFLNCRYFQLDKNIFYSLEGNQIITYPLKEYSVDTLSVKIPKETVEFLIRNQNIIIEEHNKLVRYKLN